jgi:hypothetical protein
MNPPYNEYILIKFIIKKHMPLEYKTRIKCSWPYFCRFLNTFLFTFLNNHDTTLTWKWVVSCIWILWQEKIQEDKILICCIACSLNLHLASPVPSLSPLILLLITPHFLLVLLHHYPEPLTPSPAALWPLSGHCFLLLREISSLSDWYCWQLLESEEGVECVPLIFLMDNLCESGAPPGKGQISKKAESWI